MKLFVWDLHGTLEKGNEHAAIDISNQALAENGYKERFSKADTRKLYGIKWHEYFAYKLPKQPHAEHVRLHKLSIAAADKDLSWLEQVKLNDHVYEVLSAIGRQHTQVLLSNTRPPHLKIYVKHLGLDRFFKPGNVLSAVKFLGDTTSKTEVVKKYLKGKKFDGMVVIGDRATDVEIAQDLKAVSYLYAHPSWPFHPAKADHKIRDLRQVLREV